MQQEPTLQESTAPSPPQAPPPSADSGDSMTAPVPPTTQQPPPPSPGSSTAAITPSAASSAVPRPPLSGPQEQAHGHEHAHHHQRFDDPFDDRNVYIPLERALETKASKRRKRVRLLVGLLVVAPSLLVLSIALVKNDRQPHETRWKWMAGLAAVAATMGTYFITRPDPRNMPEL